MSFQGPPTTPPDNDRLPWACDTCHTVYDGEGYDFSLEPLCIRCGRGEVERFTPDAAADYSDSLRDAAAHARLDALRGK